MGDNKRWFKVWTSILTDPAFLDMNLEDIGRWMLLGAEMAAHGNGGKITISCNALSTILRCQKEQLNDVILKLPNISNEKQENDNGVCIVTFNHWLKYQVDSTGYERVKKHRKRQNDNGIRREEKRREESKKRSIFIPPTLEEVKSYCLERKNSVDPQQFIDHYEARGWKPKGYTQKMKSWQATVRTWEKNEQGKSNNDEEMAEIKRELANAYKKKEFASDPDILARIDREIEELEKKVRGE